jgi:hypothetical protein
MDSGWIKLHRKFISWEWFTTPDMVHLFVYLLLMANREDDKWQGIEIKRGQLITGRKKLSEQTGISERRIRTCLQRLQNTGELTSKSTSKYSILTICNYDVYQPKPKPSDQQTVQPTTNERPASDHKQEVEEKKEDIKYTYSQFYDSEITKSDDDLYLMFVKFLYGENDIERKLTKILSMKDQLTAVQFEKLRKKSVETGGKIKDVCLKIENNKVKYSSVYLTINNFLNKGY